MDDAYKRQLEEIYKSHYDRYIRYATYLLHNSNQAEDMVHEAFLLAVAHEDKSKEHPEAWIMKTLKNVCMNHIKKYAVRKPKLDDFIENQPTSEPSFDVQCCNGGYFRDCVFTSGAAFHESASGIPGSQRKHAVICKAVCFDDDSSWRTSDGHVHVYATAFAECWVFKGSRNRCWYGQPA